MFGNHMEEPLATAADIRRHLFQLQAERALALDSGLAEVATYMGELDEEIAISRRLYVVSAVTEIAKLRAELSEPGFG
jgi:hypothetical protein